MYLIVGLGNIGLQYKNTRHNIGFEVINQISKDYNIEVNKKKHKGEIGEGVINGQKVMLVKPQTYMNLSGECVKAIVDFYKIPIENIIVIFDDFSLDVGKIRVRPKGSAGGQNGMKNIIQQLGTDNIKRIRVGIGEKPNRMILSDHVLSRFNKNEEELKNEAVEKASEAVASFVSIGIDKTMTKFNTVG